MQQTNRTLKELLLQLGREKGADSINQIATRAGIPGSSLSRALNYKSGINANNRAKLLVFLGGNDLDTIQSLLAEFDALDRAIYDEGARLEPGEYRRMITVDETTVRTIKTVVKDIPIEY